MGRKKIVIGDENLMVGEDGKKRLSFPGIGLGKGRIAIAEGSKELIQKGECILSADEKTLYCFTEREGKRETLNIPSGVERISAYAGKGIEEIETVAFPNSLEEIEAEAFITTHFSKEVRLPRWLTHIGEDAFGTGTTIYLPRTLKTIGEGALYGFKEVYAYPGAQGLAGAICHTPLYFTGEKMAPHALHLFMPKDGKYHTLKIPFLLTRKGLGALEETCSGREEDLSSILTCFREFEQDEEGSLAFYLSLRDWYESFSWDFPKEIQERIETISAKLAMEWLLEFLRFGYRNPEAALTYLTRGRVTAPYLSMIMYYAEENEMRRILSYCKKQGASTENYRHTLEVQEKALQKRVALRDALWAVEHLSEDVAIKYLDKEEFTDYGKKKILEAANAQGMSLIAAKILEMDKGKGKQSQFRL